MKSRDTLVRLKRFQVEEKRRRLTQIEMMIAEFNRMSAELDREIAAEEQKTGVKDISHYAYSTYARAARTRRDNLVHSADELKGQLDEARRQLDQANDDLAKAQSLESREKAPVLGDLARDVMDLAGLRGARA
jgi:flagellar export protein FliJ